MPFPAVVDLDDIAAGTGGFKIQGEDAQDRVGSSVSAAGDVNGDGIDDLIVGAPRNGGEAGAAYVVFGRTGAFTSSVDLDAIAAGTGGFKISGKGVDGSGGLPVSDAGDVNGDGIDDLIVGVPFDDSDGILAGAAYVVFGRVAGFDGTVDLDDVTAGIGGFKIQSEGPNSLTGTSVSAAGDVNGDGIDDLIVGADRRSIDWYGAAYVVFGRRGGFAT